MGDASRVGLKAGGCDNAQENTHGTAPRNHWRNSCRGVNGALRGIVCVKSVVAVCLSSFPCVPLLSPINPFRGGARLCHPARRNPTPSFPGGRSPVKPAMLFALRVNIAEAPMGLPGSSGLK